MQKWYVSLALACGCSIAFVNIASAQVVIQVQVQGQAQAQPAQVQILPAKAQIQADRIAMPGPGFNGGNRLAQADAVFVGRVVAFEPMDVEATPDPKGAKATYRVAVVQVTESIFGLKKDTQQVRVAFLVQGNNVPNGAGGGIQIQPIGANQPAIQPLPPGGGFKGRRPFPGNFQMQLQMGQDGLFTVNKHHKEAFFLAPTSQNFVNRQDNAGFDGQVKTAKQLCKVMANPVASLKAEDKQDRYTAAAILVNKYRTNPTGQPMKTEQIDAEESKLILKALAEGDWAPNRFGGAVPAPYELFNQLGITVKDGYNPVNLRTAQEVYQAMQKFLDENNGKYRVTKLVVDPNAKAPVIQLPMDPKPGVRPLPIKIRPGIQPLPAEVPLEIELDVPAPRVLPAPPVKRN